MIPSHILLIQNNTILTANQPAYQSGMAQLRFWGIIFLELGALVWFFVARHERRNKRTQKTVTSAQLR